MVLCAHLSAAVFTGFGIQSDKYEFIRFASMKFNYDSNRVTLPKMKQTAFSDITVVESLHAPLATVIHKNAWRKLKVHNSESEKLH